MRHTARDVPGKATDIARIVGLMLLWVQGESGARAAMTGADPPITLQISPRICTLTEKDRQCETSVHAQWHSSHEESLCLVIVSRPDVKHCWEHYSQGTYTLELTFAEDLMFQLRDVSLEHVFASEVLRVIREAVRFRHRRRQPWSLFD